MEAELENILRYWMKHTIDQQNGGFYGKIDGANKIYPDAPKGSVLNSRILWAFSSAARYTANTQYRLVAQRAFQFISDCFLDKEFGGVYWTVSHEGKPLDTKKQIYAQAFAVYGLSEYFLLTGEVQARKMAVKLYKDIVRYSYDDQYGGYVEALSREWGALSDLRLSAKDANEKKSMNTHLHLLEGFTNLYRTWPDPDLKERIRELVRNFLDHIINKDSAHLILFFDEQWTPRSQTVSYGHDIEAAWLLLEAAEVIEAADLVDEVKMLSVTIALAAREGLDADGGLWYEFEPSHNHTIRQKHSWPQGEAMIGFFNAWEISGDESFLQDSINSWRFTEQYILDKKNGEWYWGVEEDYAPMQEDKAGLWKCPYHNTRACLEIIKRINHLKN